MYYLAPLVKSFAPNPRTLLMSVCYCSGVPVLTVILSKCEAKFLDNYCSPIKFCVLFAHMWLIRKKRGIAMLH